jgi:hypothetical protein
VGYIFWREQELGFGGAAALNRNQSLIDPMIQRPLYCQLSIGIRSHGILVANSLAQRAVREINRDVGVALSRLICCRSSARQPNTRNRRASRKAIRDTTSSTRAINHHL